MWFITPVHGRVPLTAICLEQRARMIEKIGARAVIVGDDESIDTAESLGLDVVRMPNDPRYLGEKFNAGYRYALERGAKHCMAVGSDSFLHEGAIPKRRAKTKAYGLVGLSSFHPYAEERVDLEIKYAAGFGVGMIYPSTALTRFPEGPCSPDKESGCDNSTWARCGRGRVEIEFQKLVPYSYTNFHSVDEQVTDYNRVSRAYARVKHRAKADIFSCLRGMYDDDLCDRIEEMYAERVAYAAIHGKQTLSRRMSRGRGLSRAKRGPDRESAVLRKRRIAAESAFARLQEADAGPLGGRLLA